MTRRAAGLLTRGSLSGPPSRLPPVAPRPESVSPHSGGTVPDSHRVPLTARFAVSLPGSRPGASVTLAGVTATRAGRWLPVVFWAGVIFTFSSIPGLGTGLGTGDLVLRKLAHFAEYAILAVLLYRAVGRAPAALALASLYAATDEVHQLFVAGRHASPLDWLIDSAGAAAGLAVFMRVGRR